MSGHWRVDPSEIGKHDHFIIETDDGRRVALNDRAALRLARPGARPTSSTTGRRSRRSGPSRSTSTRSELQAPAGRPNARRSSCCCSTSGSSPGSATSMSARRCTAPASIRKRAGGSISLERLEAAGAGDPRRARRSDRGRRLDACAISPARTASSAISPRASRSTTARGSRAPAAGRSGGSSRAAARPSIARAASVDLDGRLCRVGEPPRRCEPLGRAVFH